jgi:sarcosine oxidase/L-pipecolate oxidase
MAIHSAGYTYFDEANGQGTISTPRTLTSDPVRGLLIPKSVVQDLRMHLKNVYPDLAEKPFSGTRLCWYENPFWTHEIRESHCLHKVQRLSRW